MLGERERISYAFGVRLGTFCGRGGGSKSSIVSRLESCLAGNLGMTTTQSTSERRYARRCSLVISSQCFSWAPTRRSRDTACIHPEARPGSPRTCPPSVSTTVCMEGSIGKFFADPPLLLHDSPTRPSRSRPACPTAGLTHDGISRLCRTAPYIEVASHCQPWQCIREATSASKSWLGTLEVCELKLEQVLASLSVLSILGSA